MSSYSVNGIRVSSMITSHDLHLDADGGRCKKCGMKIIIQNSWDYGKEYIPTLDVLVYLQKKDTNEYYKCLKYGSSYVQKAQITCKEYLEYVVEDVLT